MIRALPSVSECVFYHARTWSLLRSTPATVVLLIAIVAAIMLQTAWPLFAALVPLMMLLSYVLRHYVETVTVSGYTVTICRGALAIHTVTFPIWQVNPEMDQLILGRILGYGTLRIVADGETYQFAGIRNLKLLRSLIIQRQSELSSPRYIMLNRPEEAQTRPDQKKQRGR